MVKDIRTATDSSAFYGAPSTDLAAVGSNIVFPALTGQYNFELWRSDGTESGTQMVIDLDDSPNGSIQVDPYDAGNSLVALNGYAYFFGNRGYGVGGLWRTDGTAAGTVKIADVDEGDANPVHSLTRVGDRLFFIKQRGSTHGEYVLWTSDGTPAGTTKLRSFTVDSTSTAAGLASIVGVDGIAYFAGWNALDGTGVELWRSDGTIEGTMPVDDIYTGAPSSTPASLIDVGGDVHFLGRWRHRRRSAGVARDSTDRCAVGAGEPDRPPRRRGTSSVSVGPMRPMKNRVIASSAAPAATSPTSMASTPCRLA